MIVVMQGRSKEGHEAGRASLLTGGAGEKMSQGGKVAMESLTYEIFEI